MRETDSVVIIEKRKATPEQEKKIPRTTIAKVTVEIGDDVMLWNMDTNSNPARTRLGKAVISLAKRKSRLLIPLLDSRTYTLFSILPNAVREISSMLSDLKPNPREHLGKVRLDKRVQLIGRH